MITIKINEIDKTNFVKTDSLKKTDNLNQRVDTLEFVMYKYDNKGSKPVLGSEVKLFDGSNLIYGGVIITIEDYLDFNKEINYVVKCKDFSHYLDKVLVVEKYKNQTVNEIIKDIYYKYVIDWRKGSDGVSISYADDVYSFEYPLVDGAPGGWLLRPNGYTWGFTGRSGLAKNGSAYGQATAPSGVQVLVLQDDAGIGEGPGYAYKYCNPAVSGYYVFAFKLAKRPYYDTGVIDFKINGIVKQTFTVGHNDFQQYFTNPIYINSGFTEMGFIITSGNSTVFVDDFFISPVNDFAIDGVSCDLEVKTISFNRISVSDCLEKLSKYTNFQWYVDYDKQINFFEKNTKVAPYNLSDELDNHVFNSLNLVDDISQLRNRIYIRGGEAEGTDRTEYQSGDGVRTHFVLANKFARKPVVIVGGVAKTVGLDYITDESQADCFWNFQEKYVRFKTAPTHGGGVNNIEFTGTPLYPIQVQLQDAVSISKYGVYEFSKKDLTIKSKEEAFAFAKAELSAYANNILEGGFETYKSGLRSGQIINIKSTLRNFDENLLIQKVSMVIIKGGATPILYYVITLATLRTLNIINLLIDLLKIEDRLIDDNEDETLEKAIFMDENISINENVVATTGMNVGNEIINVNENFTNFGLNYSMIFAYGDFNDITFLNSDFENLPPDDFEVSKQGAGFINNRPSGDDICHYQWCFYNYNGSTVKFDRSIKKTGSASMKIHASNTGYSEVMVCDKDNNFAGYGGTSFIQVLPNTSYRFSYDIKTELLSGSGTGTFAGAGGSFIITDINGTIVGEVIPSSYIKTTQDWTTITIDYTTPATAKYLRASVRVYCHWDSGFSMNAWFDNLKYQIIDFTNKRHFLLDSSPLG